MEAVKGIYHPDKLDAETFINNFTIRLKEFKSIVENLKKQNRKPLQHFLITGKRGMGKSTLLRRLYLEAKKKPLSDKLIAVRLSSEQYKLSRLYKLWEEVINHLSMEDESLHIKRTKIIEEKNYEELLIHIIVDYLNKQNRTLLLLIDNFDQFVDKLNEKEQHAFREILIQYPIQIIGNTIFYGEHFFKYEKAFFDFFKPIHLRNLDKEEAEEFIKQLAVSEEIENFDDILKNQKGKIETLRILSGGVPRTLVILLSILSKRNTGDAIDYLNEMLEQVTPLYQDRMKALSSQQQEIMHHLAIHWDRTPAKDLATETRIPSKSISAQLAQLEDSGYINKVSTSKRNHLYEIDERFFNIWLLMSESSAYDVKRVIWLTKWLDMFYESAELEEYASYCSVGLKKAKPTNRFLIMQALSESGKLNWKFRDELVELTKKELSSAIPEVKEWAISYSKEKNRKKDILDEEIEIAFKNEEFPTVLLKLDQYKYLDEPKTNFGYGLAYEGLEEYDKAEQYYLTAVEKGNEEAMVNLGVLYYYVKKDYDKAEQYYLMAVEKGDEKAMFNLGFLYDDVKKDYDKAEQYYLMAVEKGNEKAMFNLGFLYDDVKKDYDKAEQYYLMAVEKGDEKAMFNLGFLYNDVKKDYDKAEQYYLIVANKGDKQAINNLAFLYYYQNNISKKEIAFQLTEVFSIESEPIYIATRIEILLWNEKIKEASSLMEEFLKLHLQNTNTFEQISSTLISFLIYKQKQFLYQLFTKEHNSLKDKFKPVYFALLQEMKNELPDEYLKMTEEISEPVNDLLKLVKDERKRLGIN